MDANKSQQLTPANVYKIHAGILPAFRRESCHYNQENKFVSFSPKEVEELQKCYDETFDAIKKGEIPLTAGMTANTHASAVTSRRAVQMALDKENVLVVSKDTVNTKVAKQGVKEGWVRGF